MSRLPIRIRLTLAFTLLMAVVLAATGLFVYLRLASGLDRAIDQGLRTRAADVAALVRQSDTGLREGRNGQADGGLAQVIGSGRRVIDATPGNAGRPLLTAGQLAQARLHASWFARTVGGQRCDCSRSRRPRRIRGSWSSSAPRSSPARRRSGIFEACFSPVARLRSCSPRWRGTSSLPPRCGRSSG